jgi:hypothetical protein
MGARTHGKGDFFYSNEDMFFPTKIQTFNLLKGNEKKAFLWAYTEFLET